MMRAVLSRLFVLLFLLVAPGAGAQTVEDRFPSATTEAPAAIEPLPIDDAVTIGTLPNGLRYYIRANAEPAGRAELRLVVHAGSLQEDDDQLGLAHFLEHLAFNGTENFEAQDLVEYMRSIGMRFGADVNASTSFDHTLYRLTVPTDREEPLETAFQILDDWAQGITVDSQAVEAERGVILAEWRARLGAGTRVRTRTDSLMYGHSRWLVRSPIGTPESIQTASRDAILRFYQDWYRPDLMAVVVVGDIDAGRIEEMVHKHFGDLVNPPSPRPREEHVFPTHDEVRTAVVTDPELTQARVELVQKFTPAPLNSVQRHRDAIAQSIFAAILNTRLRDISTGAGAPFLSAHTRFREFVGGMNTHTVLTVGVNDDRVIEGFHAGLSEVERIAQHGVTAQELEREKRSARTRYTQALVRESEITSAAYATSYIQHFLSGRTPASTDAAVALSQALLEEITADEVQALANQWKTGQNLVLVAALPETEAHVPPVEAELRAALDQVAANRLAAEPASAEVESPLMPQLPTPGSVVETRYISEVGITEWRLSNGARVLLKPTSFSPDQILLDGYAWGGTSVIADGDLHHAALARNLPAVTGLGELSPGQLRNAVVGKLLRVGVSIGGYTQSLSGQSTRRDLETFFQLAHLHFTAPRLDDDAIESWRHRTRTSIRGRVADPQAHFVDSLRVVLSQRHPRRRGLTTADIDGIDPQRALEIYQERFGDASSFTFALVGDFDPDSIRPLVERYIASLPAGADANGWRDTGVRPPSGVEEKEFRFGREPRARVAIVFHGPFTTGLDDQMALRAMVGVLDARLRGRLREELGGTYAVGVRPQVQSIPEPAYEIHISFDAGANQADEMAHAVFEEVEGLRRDGPTAAEVAQVREEYSRQLELSRTDNGFWLRMIRAYDQLGQPLRGLLQYGEIVGEIDRDLIHQMTREYLDAGRHVRVTQLPAD
jgi:zinc protease